MHQIVCPSCRRMNDADQPLYGQDVACGSCGYVFSIPPPVALRAIADRPVGPTLPPTPQTRQGTGGASNGQLWAYTLLACFAMVFFAWAYVQSEEEKRNPKPPKPRRTPDHYDAVAAAQDIVSQRLRAPSTAKFVRSGCSAQKQADGSWLAVVEVDAQNGFGAMLRERYRVKMIYDPVYDSFFGKPESLGR